MTGPYQRAITHLASTYHPSDPKYAGAFEMVIATFPAYTSTEIAQDVMQARRLVIETRSPLIIDRALFDDLARHDRDGAR